MIPWSRYRFYQRHHTCVTCKQRPVAKGRSSVRCRICLEDQVTSRKRNPANILRQKARRIRLRQKVLLKYGPCVCGEQEISKLNLMYTTHPRLQRGRDVYSFVKTGGWPEGFVAVCRKCLQVSRTLSDKPKST